MARRSFTIEFKTSAARLVRDQGYSAPQAARSLGVDVRSIRDWVGQVFAPQPGPTPDAEDAGSPLRREVERGSAPTTSDSSWSARFPKSDGLFFAKELA